MSIPYAPVKLIRVPALCRSLPRWIPSSIRNRRLHSTKTVNEDELNGVFAVDKPADMTSNDVLSILKKSLNPQPRPLSSLGRDSGPRNDTPSSRPKKLKMGHGGTLDPFATGVLVVAVGSGTKSLSQYLACTKEYLVTGVFGSATDTYDLTGTQTHTAPHAHVTLSSLLAILPNFQGPIMQQPPLYSALKRNGVRLYDLARHAAATGRPDALKNIPLPDPRPVTIHELEVVDWITESPPRVTLRVKCSKGTYIRSLVHDIGKQVGSAAHVVELRRTRQGEWA
ncbi:pseudouridine synthase, partial [Catenaria anguillulae PL171]